MPVRFMEVVPDKLYRGGAPTSIDVYMLKNKWGIQQIISLDKKSAKTIADDCLRLGIMHIIIPVHEYEENGHDIMMDEIDKQSVNKILNNKVTYVHCKHGKDRTGMFIGRYRTENGWSAYNAVEEAVKFGFGTGVDLDTIQLYLNVINHGPDAEQPVTIDDWEDLKKKYMGQCLVCEMPTKNNGVCEYCESNKAVTKNLISQDNKKVESNVNTYNTQTRRGIVQALKKYITAQQISEQNISQEVSALDKKMTKDLIEHLDTFTNLIEILINNQIGKFIDLFKNNQGITYEIIKEVEAEPYFVNLGKNLKKNIWRLIGNRYIELNKYIDENQEKKNVVQSTEQKEQADNKLNTLFDVCLELLSKFNKDTHIGPMQKSLEETVKGLADLVVEFADYLENNIDNEDMQKHITDSLTSIEEQTDTIKKLIKDRIIYALNKDVLGKDKPYNDDNTSMMTLKEVINKEE